jgi:hypothetical protein
VLTRPPSWFHGSAPAAGFLIGIHGRYVLPVLPGRSSVAIPAKPWCATTFISRELSVDDLREPTGDELAALTLITARVARRWLEGTRDPGTLNADQQADARRSSAKFQRSEPSGSSAPAKSSSARCWREGR